MINIYYNYCMFGFISGTLIYGVYFSSFPKCSPVHILANWTHILSCFYFFGVSFFPSTLPRSVFYTGGFLPMSGDLLLIDI